jgi:hypothetical protein
VRQHLVALFGAAVEDQLIARNPASGVRVPEHTAGEVVPPSPGDEDRIRQAVDAVHAQRAEDWLRTAGPHR